MRRKDHIGRIKQGILALLALSVLLCACNRKSELPDLSGMGETVMVSREDGSGTRTEFEALVNTDGAGTSRIAASTDEVVELVANARNAIGYVAFSSISEKEGVKFIGIDGVLPSNEAVKKGTYPLCRNYYLAYSGSLNAVETDFLTYVLGAGQEIVGESCVAVKKSVTFLSDKSEGEIRICGSSSMAPILQALVADYRTYNPGAVITIEATDSGSGLTAAIRGECDFAMSSRSLKNYEEELLTNREIGKDAIVLVVNQENPLAVLSKKQVKSLYDGNCRVWGELD